jgi:hypothetical protein
LGLDEIVENKHRSRHKNAFSSVLVNNPLERVTEEKTEINSKRYSKNFTHAFNRTLSTMKLA